MPPKSGKISADNRPIHPADHRPTVNWFNVLNLDFTGVSVFARTNYTFFKPLLAINCNFKGCNNSDI